MSYKKRIIQTEVNFTYKAQHKMISYHITVSTKVESLQVQTNKKLYQYNNTNGAIQSSDNIIQSNNRQMLI